MTSLLFTKVIHQLCEWASFIFPIDMELNRKTKDNEHYRQRQNDIKWAHFKPPMFLWVLRFIMGSFWWFVSFIFLSSSIFCVVYILLCAPSSNTWDKLMQRCQMLDNDLICVIIVKWLTAQSKIKGLLHVCVEQLNRCPNIRFIYFLKQLK